MSVKLKTEPRLITYCEHLNTSGLMKANMEILRRTKKSVFVAHPASEWTVKVTPQ